jgi:hypothetical protein
LALPHLYNKDTALFFNGNKIFIKRMKKLIKNILRESKDEFDWIREVPTTIPFEEAVIGKKYRIETTEVLMGALEACYESEWLYNSTEVEVIDSDTKSYSGIFCDDERKDKVFTLKLKFYQSTPRILFTQNFWVTDDMVTLYEKAY